ncbi:MAG: hypothetical protein SAK29_25210 [Scytonema sp. PMC 1069.18]|nr:hypothetical protein [Scytonema sp. PMC 1069.18]MEC4883189.1 hypothetical protein [Scytonema sp. PMC 1070.18]
MGRNSKLAIVAILTLAIASCSSEGTEESTKTTPSTTSEANTPSLPNKAANQPFNNPVVPAKQASSASPVSSASANLIRPTNATERVDVVSKGRDDPFAQILGPYSYSSGMPNTPGLARSIPQLPPLPVARGVNVSRKSARGVNVGRKSAVISKAPRGATLSRSTTSRQLQTGGKLQKNKKALALAKKPIKNTPKRASIPVLPKVLPQVVANPGFTPVVPPPPQPELARAVYVSGIVLIGREPQAIIKVPNEPTSRYVQAGQRLANGVLVKRIEMNEGSEPIVILEQYGMEVAKMVGEAPANSTQSPTAAVGSPVSVAAPTQNNVSDRTS